MGYLRTLWWSRRLPKPKGNPKAWPYWKGCELALLAAARRYWTAFPAADSYSFLEFGVASGNSLRRLLSYRDALARSLRFTTPIHVLGFDTFEGMPAPKEGDEALPYIEGDYLGDIEAVRKSVADFENVWLVPGLFADTLPAYRERLTETPPIFVSIDCDYYTSTIDVLEEILPLCPHGAVWYFDETAANFWSSKTGEMRAIREVNEGRFGDQYELVEYPLWIETREARHWHCLWRLVNLEKAEQQNTALVDRGIEIA